MEEFIEKLINLTKREMEYLDNKLLTSQERIREAYGENYDNLKGLIGIDGWCSYTKTDKFEIGAEVPNTYDYDVEFDPPYGYYWRPKSLKL